MDLQKSPGGSGALRWSGQGTRDTGRHHWLVKNVLTNMQSQRVLELVSKPSLRSIASASHTSTRSLPRNHLFSRCTRQVGHCLQKRVSTSCLTVLSCLSTLHSELPPVTVITIQSSGQYVSLSLFVGELHGCVPGMTAHL